MFLVSGLMEFQIYNGLGWLMNKLLLEFVLGPFFNSDIFIGFLLLANAWEEEDEVVLITCRVQNPDLDMVNGGVKEKLENFTNEL